MERVLEYSRVSDENALKHNVDLGGESAEIMGVDFLAESVEKQLRDLEDREEFAALSAAKRRKLSSSEEEEEELSLTMEEILNDVKLKKDELNQRLDSVRDWIKAAHAQVKGIRGKALKKLKKIRAQEQSMETAQQSLAERERKVEIVIETLDDRINAVEAKEKDFNLFLDAKMTELGVKEEKLNKKWLEFVRESKLADNKYRGPEKLRCDSLERLELAKNRLEGVIAMINDKFKQIEYWENVGRELVEGVVKEADLIMESMEKQMYEFDKMMAEFNTFKEDKMRELDSKEKQLSAMSEQICKDARMRNIQLMANKKFGEKLLERLELEKNNVEELRRSVAERVKEVNSLSKWVERKMDEADSKAKKLEEQEVKIRTMEDDLIAKRNEVVKKEEELDLKEKSLNDWERELQVKHRDVELGEESNENRMEELDWKEKNINSVREFVRSCFREHRFTKKQLRVEKDTVEKLTRELKDKEVQLQESEFKEKQFKDRIEALELRQQQLTDVINSNVKVESNESADIKFILRMDGKTLQWFINDPEKNLESMGDEIFKVLHLSPNPAKLVLDAMVGFYPPHLRKGDEQCRVRESCIVVLEQFCKMSVNIQAQVTEEAIELANSWKSKMSENPLEVLAFLHLLAAYNLVLHFDTDEISRFLMMVGECRQGPELRRLLGFK